MDKHNPYWIMFICLISNGSEFNLLGCLYRSEFLHAEFSFQSQKHGFVIHQFYVVGTKKSQNSLENIKESASLSAGLCLFSLYIHICCALEIFLTCSIFAVRLLLLLIGSGNWHFYFFKGKTRLHYYKTTTII